MNSNHTALSSRTARLGTVGALCAALAIPAIGQDTGTAEDPAVSMTGYGTVTLAVQDTDLAQVLEMLSIQSQKNIITSRNVSATISANLYDVTFYEALDSILKVNGYDYIEEGNFIYIYTQAEMEEIRLSTLKPESRIFELNYLSASDANELIAPLLSESGRSSFRGDVQPGIEPDSSDVGQDNWAFTAMLVVNDFPDNLESVTNLLNELDVPPKQVLIESTILQTTLNEKNAFGIDFSIVSSLDFTDLTNPLSAVEDMLAGTVPDDNNAKAITQTVGNTGDPGTFKLGVIRDDASVFLRVLDQVSDLTVLARPKVMCLNRQRAEVLVGRRVGYLSTTATETSSTQTVEFLDTGIHLMFRPFISTDGMIRLELAPSVSDFVLREVAGSGTSKVTIPDEVTNELTTNVRVHDGNTLVLGGLFRESNDIKRRQVPILGDIPLVGAAFRGQDDEVKLDEIIFLITPSVVHDELAWSVGDSALGYSDALLVGSRQGLLPFSRQRMTVGYNARAQDAFDRGQLDQALHYVNDSLRLNSQQPRAQRLRDQIMQMREPDSTIGAPFERNILENIMRKELGPVGSSVSNMPSMGEGFDDFPSFDELFTPEIDAESTPGDEPAEPAVEVVEATEEPLSSAQDMEEAGVEPASVEAPLHFEEIVIQNNNIELVEAEPEATTTPENMTNTTAEEVVAFDSEADENAFETTETFEETLEEMTVASSEDSDFESSEFETTELASNEAATIEVENVENDDNLFEVASELADNTESSNITENETVAANTSIELDADDFVEPAPVEPHQLAAQSNRRRGGGWGSSYRRTRADTVAPLESVVEVSVPAEPEVAGPQRLVTDVPATDTATSEPFFHNTPVSTYPELAVPGWPPAYDTPMGEALATTEPLSPAERDALTDRLVSEYFSTLGVSRLTQYPRKEDDDDQDEFALPSITFDDMFNDLIEEMQQAEGVVEADEDAPFIED
ncbi:MAG: type II secretion system protein GspD [Planctomycetota bacterium]|jgi:type IV pilus assembly protein PilQ